MKVAVLGTLRMPGHKNQKWDYQLTEKSDVYFHAKTNLIPHFFSEILHFE